MPVTCTAQDRALIAVLTGEVDHHAAKEMMATLQHQISAALPSALTLDLSGVTFMDSSGIAVLMRTWRRMKELDGRMTVINVPAQAGKVLKAAGVDRLIPII